MTLTALPDPVTATTLNSNFDDATSTLTTNAKAGQKDQTRTLYLGSLASGADVSLRSYAWTQPDDAEVRMYFATVTDTAVRAFTISLEVDNGDTTFLVDNTLSITLATANGTVDTRTAGSGDLRTTTGVRVRLLKGVRYRLILHNTSGGTITGPLEACVQLRSMRRNA